MNKLIAVVLLAVSSLLVGCQGEAPKTESVAVFDIDRVADETGMFQSMQKKLAVKRESLKKELKEFRVSLKAQLQEEGKKIAKKTKDKKQRMKKIAMLEQAAQIQFSKGQAKAEQALNAYNVSLVDGIRKSILPVAQEVYKELGYKVLLLRNPLIVYDVAAEADLTDAILQRYQTKYPDAKKILESAIQPSNALSGNGEEALKVDQPKEEAKPAEEEKKPAPSVVKKPAPKAESKSVVKKTTAQPAPKPATETKKAN